MVVGLVGFLILVFVPTSILAIVPRLYIPWRPQELVVLSDAIDTRNQARHSRSCDLCHTQDHVSSVLCVSARRFLRRGRLCFRGGPLGQAPVLT